MSSNFYFHKWRNVLAQLNAVIQIDLDYQVSKAHDKRRCQAVERLTGMLAAYISGYNDVLECSQQNLQVQKTKDINAVLQAVVDRILELKHQLRKLEGCQAQFLSKGTIQQHLTVKDAEFQDIPFKITRGERVGDLIKNAISAAKEKIIQRELELAKEEDKPEEISELAWWELDDADLNKDEDETTGDIFERYDKVEEISDETLKIRDLVALIQAHEKTRQVTQCNLQRIQKREMWEKMLLGTLAPQARPEVKERAAKLIQKVVRIYMDVKRKRVAECKRNELLGIKQCGKFKYDERNKAEQLKERRIAIFKQFDDDWKNKCASIKEEFLKRKQDELKEHYRDSIRDWFQDWYNRIGLFHDIPRIKKGGTVAIWREEIPTPEEWYQQYKEYVAEKQRNKNKPSQQAKLGKQAKLMEQKRLKLEEKTKKRLEEQLKRKMMKNPNMHPGYHYPESKKLHTLIEALEHYHTKWDELDAEESVEVKERSVKQLDEENLYAEVKLEIATEVDADMKNELKKLKTALKKDYENAEEEMPEPMPEKKRRRAKKKKKVEKTPNDEILAEKMEFLAENGFLKEYPRTKFEEFFGDHNMTGDDCRCLDKEANQFAGETRSIWWERCRLVSHGCHKILVVGPASSGRTTLVHAMASVNDAVLFELVPQNLDVDLVTPAYLQLIVDAVAISARGVQPAVIYIKNVHQLYFKKKKDANAALPNAEMIKRYFIGKLFKRIHKTDNITIVGSCSDPWLTKTSKLLKKFPEVVLVPDTSYSVVVQLLNNWVVNNRCIPRDLDVHTLARALRGHSFAFIKTTLEHFLAPEPVVRMAAYGLHAKEIFEYVMETGVEKPDYEQYLKWYANFTFWGKKERKQLEEAREFRAAEEKYAEVKEKKKKKGIKTPGSSEAGHAVTKTAKGS